jgi:quinol monooxygenase YgiN
LASRAKPGASVPSFLVIVIYGSFRVDTEDRRAFDEWYRSCLSIARQEKGCVAYDYLLDPQQPDRGFNLEIWETADDFQAHMLHPAHVEMMALASRKWGVRDLRMHFWMDAQGHQYNIRERTETPVEGRGNLYERIAALQAKHGGNA